MVGYLDRLWIFGQNRLKKMEETFLEESGVSSFVATILLILIVVMLCAMFWGKISEWFNEMWDKIIELTKLG